MSKYNISIPTTSCESWFFMKTLTILTEFFKKAIQIVKGLPRFSTNFKKIRTKLILSFIVPIFLIVFQGTTTYMNSSKMSTTNIKNSIVASMDDTANYLEVVTKSIENQASQIFSNQDIQEYLTNKYNEYDQMTVLTKVQRTLRNIASNSDEINCIVLVPTDESIKSQFSSSYTPISMNQLKDSPFIKKLESEKASNAWIGYHKELDEIRGENHEPYSFSFVQYIRSNTTLKTLGLLIIDVNPEVVSKVTDSMMALNGQQFILVTPDNRVLTNGTDSTDTSTLVNQTFFTEAYSGKDSTGSIDGIDYNGIEYLFIYEKIADTGNMLVGLVPLAEMYASIRPILVLTVVLSLVAVALAILTGIIIANSMSRTINRIIEASTKAASGDLTISLRSRRQDELGTLTRSINSMITNMRNLIEQTIDVSEKVSNSAKTVTRTSLQVSNVSQDISRAIQEISLGATEQATDAEQGVRKISSLAEKINNVTANAKHISKLTDDTKAMTQNGLLTVEDLDVKAGKTTEITREIVEDISQLDIQSKSIGKIVKVINSIANQTNLLALNATIEAAMAGESGKGFAVVAAEVRKLAERSMESTREITNIIKATQDQTTKTVKKATASESILKSQNEAVLSTNKIFKKIMESMENLLEQVNQIMSSIAEMDGNKAQAVSSIQNISAVSEETAASSQEVTASTQEQLSCIEELSRFSEDLRVASDELQRSIAMFTLE